MKKESKNMDDVEKLVDKNESQEPKNKKDNGLLKGLTGYLKKHFLDDKNYESALKVTREILENASPENKTNVFNMIKNTFDSYEVDKNETVESDIKNNAR